MMNVEVHLESNYFDKVNENMDKAIAETIQKVSEQIQENAKSIVPEESGELKDSIDMRIEDNVGVVFTNSPYANAIEFGKHGRRGTFFMYRSAKGVGNMLIENAKKGLE